MRANRYSAFALTLAALAALCVGTPDASAKQRNGRGRKTESVRMNRPAGSSEARARGTVEVTTSERKPDAVIRLRNLEPRSVYRVVETRSGAELGTVTANGKGRATFSVAAENQAKRTRAAANGGADASEDTTVPFDDMDGVEVVCDDTDECILECDFGGLLSDEARFLTGDAWYGEAETGTGMVSMYSYDDGEFASDSFSFTYCPPYDPSSGGYDMPHSLWLDTANGDALPLGVTSVGDLAGLDFEVRSTEGAVVLTGELPDLEEISFEPCVGIWEGEWDWEGDWGGEWDSDWSGDWNDDWSNGQDDPWLLGGPLSFDEFANISHDQSMNTDGQRGARHGKARGGVRDGIAVGEPDPNTPTRIGRFILAIRDPNTELFVEVGNLDAFEWNWDDGDQWDDEWNDDFGDEWNWEGEWNWDNGATEPATDPAGVRPGTAGANRARRRSR